jgi:glyoxylase-like metal-dependent hydrolase (beta-lactamase superfamily II)
LVGWFAIARLAMIAPTMNRSLMWDVFVAPGIPTHTPELPPGQKETRWSPIASTLIYGDRDAVLVDPLLTEKQADALASWVEQHGKRLTTIYATHGHGDHWFGAATILRRFPDARFLAKPEAIDLMRRQTTKPVWDFWNERFPGQLSAHPAPAESLDGQGIDLEGHELRPIEVGHTDTDDTTILHVPDIGLVVAGDVVYNGVHLYLAESDHAAREHWIDALDTVAKLQPHAVIAGHKRPGNDDDPRNIEETKTYIRDFDRLRASTDEPEELYKKMMELHPDRVNPDALWLSVQGAKP